MTNIVYRTRREAGLQQIGPSGSELRASAQPIFKKSYAYGHSHRRKLTQEGLDKIKIFQEKHGIEPDEVRQSKYKLRNAIAMDEGRKARRKSISLPKLKFMDD